MDVNVLKGLLARITETNLTIEEAMELKLAIEYIEDMQDTEQKFIDAYSCTIKEDLIEDALWAYMTM
ncbi:MAG: hypothetical protein BV457_08425 [Thermoplasmata archaeon M9B1D]|nr:MAG: hypothetical protein BV457_08425 [Thermoplasmata archaeon M9B1D]